VVSSTPRPHFTPGKDTVPIVQEAGWAPGPVLTGGKSRPHRDSIPDRPARSQSPYRLSYRAHNTVLVGTRIQKTKYSKELRNKREIKQCNIMEVIDTGLRNEKALHRIRKVRTEEEHKIRTIQSELQAN